MAMQVCRTFLMSLAGASIALAAHAAGPGGESPEAEIQRLRNELSRVEAQLEKTRRVLPPTFDPAAEESFARKALNDLKLSSQIRSLPGSESVPLANGKPSPIGSNNSGPLSMHLRDVELPVVFYVLHDLTRENFIVDQNVRGQVRVDIEQATLEETLAAMKTAGLDIGPGPLRRVSLAGKAEGSKAPAETYTGEPVNLVFQDAAVPDVLCLFTSLTGLTFMIPDNLRGRTSIYAHDLRWDWPGQRDLRDGPLAGRGSSPALKLPGCQSRVPLGVCLPQTALRLEAP